MSRIGDYSFSPLARFIPPESDGSSAPIVFRSGGTRFPSISFWRSRYGSAERAMQPHFAEWLAQDFQELEAYRFGLCIRVLDFVYGESAGGSPDERECVLAELNSLVAAGEILQLRVCEMQPEYRHYRLQFFRDHSATDFGFWHRLALVYARLAAHSTPNTSQTVWWHALLEEARGFDCPAFTPELISALSAMGPSVKAEIAASECGNCDSVCSEPLPDASRCVVEFADTQMPGKINLAECRACPEVASVKRFRSVIPELQSDKERSALSEFTPTAATQNAPLDIFEIEVAPGVFRMTLVFMPGVAEGFGYREIVSSAKLSHPRFAHCRAPPQEKATAVIPKRKHHGRYPARGPPEELRGEK